VRSYLAVPVISRRARCWAGCCSVIPRRGVFTERAQHLVAGIAAEAGIALDNARLYHWSARARRTSGSSPIAMPQIVWTALPDGRFDYYNRPLVRLHRAHRSCAGRSGLDDLHHPEDCQACREKWREALKSNQSFQSECA